MAVAQASGLRREDILWPTQDASLVEDTWSAARYCIDLLRASRWLRCRFPRALSEGASGAFARWITHDRRGLTPQARTAIRLAFAAEPAEPVRHLFTAREDVRANFPLGLLPPGLSDFIPWLFRHGMAEQRLRSEAIWWFALEAAEHPGAELVRTYLFTPGWQSAVPDGVTVFGRAEFADWLRATYALDASWLTPKRWPVTIAPARQIRLAYACRADWQREHPRAFDTRANARQLLRWLATPEARGSAAARAWCANLDIEATARELVNGGVNVFGHMCYPSGLRISAEVLIEGLRRCGTDVALRDVPVHPSGDEPRHHAFADLPCYDVTIVHVEPEPLFDRAFGLAGVAARRGGYRIGYWYWEVDTIPETWLAQQDGVDELWTASEFVADALRTRFRVPVLTLPPGIELPPFARRSRSHFGLPENRFLFSFVFHMTSGMERKNPLGLIAAFRQAFGGDPSVALVLKTSFGSRHPELMRDLQEAAAEVGGHVIDAVFSREETLALMEACDCYVSLHRSEGFGLTMAEAMLLGKPVIATGYSGNLDFMDPGNSLLVDYELVELGRAFPPYEAGSHWAEPSVRHAAQLMRRVYENRAWARELGAKARQGMAARMSLEASGQRMADRLKQVAAGARGNRPG